MTKQELLQVLCKEKSLRYVGFRGSPRCPIRIVGEAPGANEDQIGLPFVGASGKLQDTMLQEAGFNISDICFSNPFNVRPPDNDISRVDELGIPKGLYIEAFLEELQSSRPTIIISTGATSTGILCPETLEWEKGKSVCKISKWKGSLLKSKFLGYDHYVIPTWHPSYIFQDWGERSISVLCYAKAFEEYVHWLATSSLDLLPKRTLRVAPSFGEVYTYLKECLVWDEPLSIDIENPTHKLVYTIAIAKSRSDAMAFCLWDYDTHQIRIIFRLLDQIIRTKWQIGQNYLTYDLHWLETLGFKANPKMVYDTLNRHHVLWPEFPHKLAFMCFQYTRQPFYKEDDKSWGIKNKAPLLKYNALDAAVTREVFDEQEKEFDVTL